ncbi:DUF3313 family protein [Halioglobus maricola]|nr:DUF3313 family protein [Halioglobus maricola]
MNTIKYIAGALAVTLLAACSSTPVMEDKPSSEFEGLNKVSSTGFNEVWGRPGTDLSSYSAIVATPLKSADAEIIQPGQSIQTRTRQDMEMTPEVEQGLAETWNDAITREAQDKGLATDGSGDKVLRIDASMTRIAPSANFAAEKQAPGRTTVYTEDSGDASIEFRLYDNTSGELLAVVRDKRSIGSQMWSRSNTVTASADVRNLYRNWANRLVTRITGN